MADEAKTAELRIKLDGSDVARGADQIEGRLDRLASKAKQAGGEAAKGFEQMPEGAKKAAKSIEDADNRIIASLKRKAAEAEAYGKGEAARQEALIRARGRDPEVFRDYLNALSAAERGNKQFLATQQGMSAASRELRVETNLTKNALRQLPAQFTDIVTSLQGGQKPMTVLLQQGGQLKDVFGGVGNAARAMGGYIAGLISPLSVAIAALGTVGYAFLKVQAEGAEYTKALVMSGNAAGGTTAQYKAMAKAIGDIGGPTQGRAAEGIASMASSALIGASNIQRFTAAALAMERAGGAAAEKTAEQFAALGKAPLDASVKLNESMNYLTRSTYDQIRALEEQGRTVEAAAAAQAAFADALEQRAPQMESALGLVERGWRRVADGAKAAWDAILNIGRSNGIDLQIKELSAQADRLRAAAGNRGVASPGQFVTALGGQSYEAQAAEIDKVIAKLRESKQLNDSVAASQAEQAKQVKALADYRKDEVQYLTKSEQANRAVTKAIVEGVAAGEKMEAIQRRVAAIQERYKDKRAGSTTESEIDLLNRLVGLTSTYNNDIAILNKRLAERKLTEEQYGEAVRKLVEVQPYMVKYTKEQADAIEKENKAYVRALEARARYIENEEKILDADKKTLLSLQARAAGLREGKEATEELLAVEVLRQANTLEALAISRYEQTLDDAQLARDRERVEVLRMIAIERRNIAQAIDDDQVEKANKKAADEAARDWERAADEIGKSLTDAIMAGGDNAAKYLRDLFRKLVLRPIIQSVVQQYGGVVGAALGGGTGQAGQYMQGAQSLQTLYGYGQAGYGYLASNGYLGGSAAYGAATDSALATSGNYYAADAAASSSAAGVSSMASYAGWAALAVAAAIQAQKDYDMGFDRGSASNSGTALGDASARTADLLSRLGVNDEWADIISGATLTARLFGRAAAQVTGSGVQGSFGGGDFAGQAYADVYEKGGLFRSGKSYQQLAALPDDIDRFLSGAAQGIMEKAQEFGAALGLPVAELNKVTSEIKLNLGDSIGNNAEDIAGALAGYGDALVAGWAEALKPVALYGETTIQTIERYYLAIALLIQ